VQRRCAAVRRRARGLHSLRGLCCTLCCHELTLWWMFATSLGTCASEGTILRLSGEVHRGCALRSQRFPVSVLVQKIPLGGSDWIHILPEVAL